MENLQISNWARHIEYEIINTKGKDYIIPQKHVGASIYNPINEETELLCDALNLGKYLTENNVGHKEQALDFVKKYGLLGIMTDITDSDLDQNEGLIIHENIFTEHGIAYTKEFSKLFFPVDDIDILVQPQKPKIRLQSRKPIYTKMFLRTYRYAEPIEWLIKYFKYLYSFMECEKDKLCGFNAPHITYRIDTRTEPKLVCDYVSLKAVIDLAFAKAVTDEKNPLRYCKHCGKVFYAKDSRSEFCSPKCRNQFNVYKSRAKR